MAIAASITKRYTNNYWSFPTFCSVTPEKNFSSQTLRVFLGEVAAVGWKPCGATLLGFDVDKGCHGETRRPRNRGLFTGWWNARHCWSVRMTLAAAPRLWRRRAFFRCDLEILIWRVWRGCFEPLWHFMIPRPVSLNRDPYSRWLY